MSKINNKRSRGFSLVEVLVVITIIALLTAAGLVSFITASKSARDGKRKSDLESVRSALVLYRTDNGSYPASVSFSNMSPIQSYISVTSLKDPKGASYTYTSNGTTFSVCGNLETTGSQYCVNNP